MTLNELLVKAEMSGRRLVLDVIQNNHWNGNSCSMDKITFTKQEWLDFKKEMMEE